MASNYYWGMWGSSSRGAPPTAEQSWEEQAFARDAAGHLGSGCVWPPRSYTCTFCRREFRSAQALGGHMNVHRRDRARLRQCASPPDHQLLVQPATPPADYSYSTPVALLLSTRPKSSTMIKSRSTTSPSSCKNKVFISVPEEEDIRMSKRRRVVLDLSPPPFFTCERNIVGDAKVISSPSPAAASILHLAAAGRQELDLELRLGTSPPHKVA